MNQIDDVCKDIEKTINLTVQNTLNTLEHDCEKIAELIDKKLAVDRFAAHLCHVSINITLVADVVDLQTTLFISVLFDIRIKLFCNCHRVIFCMVYRCFPL